MILYIRRVPPIRIPCASSSLHAAHPSQAVWSRLRRPASGVGQIRVESRARCRRGGACIPKLSTVAGNILPGSHQDEPSGGAVAGVGMALPHGYRAPTSAVSIKLAGRRSVDRDDVDGDWFRRFQYCVCVICIALLLATPLTVPPGHIHRRRPPSAVVARPVLVRYVNSTRVPHIGVRHPGRPVHAACQVACTTTTTTTAHHRQIPRRQTVYQARGPCTRERNAI